MAEKALDPVDIDDELDHTPVIDDAALDAGDDIQADDDDVDPPANDGDGEEVVFGFGDESDEDHPDDTTVLRTLRQRQREDAREKAEMRRELDALKAKLPTTEALGPEPQMEDFGFDEQEWKAEWVKWNGKKAQHEARQTEAQKTQQAQQAAWQTRVGEFYTKAEELRIPNLKDIEQSISDAFGDDPAGNAAKSILIYSGDPRLIAALSASPAKLSELVALKDRPVELAIAVGELKGKTVKKVLPKPDKALRGQAPSMGGDKHLAKLEAEAARTGDRSKLIAYRAQLKDKAA